MCPLRGSRWGASCFFFTFADLGGFSENIRILFHYHTAPSFRSPFSRGIEGDYAPFPISASGRDSWRPSSSFEDLSAGTLPPPPPSLSGDTPRPVISSTLSSSQGFPTLFLGGFGRLFWRSPANHSTSPVDIQRCGLGDSPDDLPQSFVFCSCLFRAP